MMSAYESRPSADPDAVTALATAKATKATPTAAADLLALSENELLNGEEGDEHVFLSDGDEDDDDVFEDDDDDAEGGASYPLLSQKRGT